MHTTLALNHFYQNIQGWCDFADYYAKIVASLPDGAKVVEVGVWHGQSTAALAVEILNSGKAVRLDVVDHFNGSAEHERSGLPMGNLRERFDANVTPVRHAIRNVHAMKSWDAAKLYADGSLDFVFIDASHDSPDVVRDVTAWWPKVKPGGILAGHDIDWVSVQAALKPFHEWAGVEVTPVAARCWQAVRPLPVMVERLVTPPGIRKCLVVICSNERSIYRQTVESLLTLGWGQRVLTAAAKHGFADVQVSWVSKFTSVADMRNEAVKIAQSGHCSHILFLDADMTWPANVLESMLAHHDKGIVSALYFLKSWPHHPVALKNAVVNPETLQVDYHYDRAGHRLSRLLTEDLVGMGCTLIPMSLFDAMSRPWFEYQQDANGVWSVTEDVAFCQKAKALGCPISVDPRIKCGHISQQPVTEAWYERSLVEMKMLEAEQKRGVA